ncbi:MAG: carbohydrate binding domain-containing protein [Lachnospiraceae bacterium]|nr:carbohydrate binding domain-containing protein [Lachnospiraceae bacterium]
MRKMKKASAIFLAATMVLSMACCDKKYNTSETATTTETDASYPEAVVIEDTEEWVTTEAPVVEDDRFTTVEGADVLGINFDDDSLAGFTTYVNGGEYTLDIEDGQMVCDINKIGSVEHGCQVYYDGFTMAEGCVYTVSFDAYCTVERPVEWRVQINGGDYHAYASE